MSGMILLTTIPAPLVIPAKAEIQCEASAEHETLSHTGLHDAGFPIKSGLTQKDGQHKPRITEAGSAEQ